MLTCKVYFLLEYKYKSPVEKHLTMVKNLTKINFM
ncbi:hypothetical protein BY457_105122 [Marinilabilia salmonicolor]|jgi:hypothetical protein|nr:hypothetical protein BY457_105122 [Marinilabilia salmonicolor]